MSRANGHRDTPTQSPYVQPLVAGSDINHDNPNNDCRQMGGADFRFDQARVSGDQESCVLGGGIGSQS